MMAHPDGSDGVWSLDHHHCPLLLLLLSVYLTTEPCLFMLVHGPNNPVQRPCPQLWCRLHLNCCAALCTNVTQCLHAVKE